MIGLATTRVGRAAMITAAMFFAAATLAYLSLLVADRMAGRVDAMIRDARTQAIAERDAHWSGEIARSNAEANQRSAEQARQTIRIQADAANQVRAAEQKLAEVETENAALPDGGACGLSRDRVRLLAR